MTEKLKNAFKAISDINPSSGLEGRVLARIEAEIGRAARRKRLFSWIGFGASFATAVVAIVYAGSALVQSEFWSLSSLLFTDAGVVLADWQTFGLSLLETLPAVSLTLLLVPVTVLFLSLWSYKSSNANHNFRPAAA